MCTYTYTHWCFVCPGAHTILFFSANQHACIQKQGPFFSPVSSSRSRERLSEPAVWLVYAVLILVENLFSLSLTSLDFPFLEHCIYDSSTFIKSLFCFWSCSFWFGLTVRTIIGIGWALQCTLYTALTKSCKRDWIRGVWHQSWLHVTKSY